MANKCTRRGYDESDERLFRGIQYEHLCKAAKEFGYLLDQGYPVKPTSTFIGNHYMFSERQRLALVRSVASKNDVQCRRYKMHTGRYLEVNIDGFNTIITLEVALSGSPIFLCTDSTIRDLAGLRGTYRIIDKTQVAINAMFDWLMEHEVQIANIYLDAPVSNSGRLKTLIFELTEKLPIQVNIYVINNVDQTLSKLDYVISSDSMILNQCKGWINMNREIIMQLDSNSKWMIEF